MSVTAQQIGETIRKYGLEVPDDQWLEKTSRALDQGGGEQLPGSSWYVWDVEEYFDGSSMGAGAGDYAGRSEDLDIKEFDAAILACATDEQIGELATKLKDEATADSVILVGDLPAWLRKTRDQLIQDARSEP